MQWAWHICSWPSIISINSAVGTEMLLPLTQPLALWPENRDRFFNLNQARVTSGVKGILADWNCCQFSSWKQQLKRLLYIISGVCVHSWHVSWSINRTLRTGTVINQFMYYFANKSTNSDSELIHLTIWPETAICISSSCGLYENVVTLLLSCACTSCVSGNSLSGLVPVDDPSPDNEPAFLACSGCVV